MEWFDNLCSNMSRFFDENDPSLKSFALVFGFLIALVVFLVLVLRIFPVILWVTVLVLFCLYSVFWFISHGYLSIHKED